VTYGLSLNDMIEAALRGQPYNQPRLGRDAKRYCDKITQLRCADMPADLHFDIFQQAFVGLLEVGAAGLVEKSGRSLFRAMILNAIRIVRSDYAQPGVRTRAMPKDAPPEKVAAEDIGRTASRADLARSEVMGKKGPMIDFDRFESATASADIQQLEDRIDGERLLVRAPADVAAMLRLICIDGERVDQTVHRFGLDRHQYYRAVAGFRADLFAAA